MSSAPPSFTPPAPGGTLYIVRNGDTLSAIATRFNVTVAAILAANNLPDEKQIRTGMPLTIPSAAAVLSVAATAAETPAAQPQAGVLGIGDPTTPIVSPQEIQAFLRGKRTTFYVVRKGDTIPRIAAIFKIDALILAQINSVRVADELIPGTRLIIPMK
jgi:LysM repeat protein